MIQPISSRPAGEEPDRAGDRLAVVEAVGARESEDPEDVADQDRVRVVGLPHGVSILARAVSYSWNTTQPPIIWGDACSAANGAATLEFVIHGLDCQLESMFPKTAAHRCTRG